MLQNSRQRIYELFGDSRLHEAKSLCLSTLKADNTDSELWSLLSAIHGQLGEFENAAAVAEKAISLSPDYPSAHFNHGLALMRLARSQQALESFHNVVRLDPRHVRALTCLGKLYDDQRKSREAIAYYEKALKLSESSADLLCSLAFLYERTHQTEKARNAVELALDNQPGRFDANLISARLDRRDGYFDTAKSTLEKVLSGPVPHGYLAEVYYELALVLDLEGQYEPAFQMFGKCQEASAAEYEGIYSGSEFLQRIKKNKASITESEHANRDQGDLIDLDDPVFLVGFPRSGTTLTEQILSSHSKVIASDEAELIPAVVSHIKEEFGEEFDYPADLDKLDRNQLEELRRRYWQMVRDTSDVSLGSCRYLDKLPLNVIELCLVQRLFPTAPVIFCLRDPRDVCLSCYTQYFLPNDSMANFLTMDSTVTFYNAVMDLWEHYKRVLRPNYKEVRYEKLVTNTEQEVRTLVEFIGLEWEGALLEYSSATGRRYVSTPSYQGVASPIYTRSVGRWKHYKSQIGDAIGGLQRFVKLYGYEQL